VKPFPGPRHALQSTTYEELEHFVGQFVDGNYSLLILIGAPGLAKSQTIKRAIGNRRHLYLETHATAFAMYQELYKHRGLAAVIDDIDHIYSDRASIRLLKSLCNTDKVKVLRWPSRHREIGNGTDQTPGEFTTTSPVCLIANEWRTLNANVQAIEDRAIIVNFTPTAGEVHAKARQWFQDMDVYDFIEEHLQYIAQPSMRYYVKGQQLRRANPNNWKDHLLTIMGLDDHWRAFVRIIHDQSYAGEAERVAEFEALGLGDRSTYYRWRKKLRRG
jgi:hypothetical protein